MKLSITSLGALTLTALCQFTSADIATAKPPLGKTTLTPAELALALSSKTEASTDTRSVNTIRNKLSLYTLSIDSQTFDIFNQIFDENVVANYSAPIGVINGLENVTATIAASFVKIGGSQHHLGSQIVWIADDNNAFSVSYYRSAQFSKSGLPNEGLYAFGQYQDSWFREDAEDQSWRIVQRNLVYMVS